MEDKMFDQINKVKSLVKQRDFNSAFSILENLFLEFPENAFCYNSRAHAFFSQKEKEKAFEDLEKAIHLQPEEPSFYFFKGYWKLKSKLFFEGEDALSNAISKEKALNSAYYLMTSYLLRAFARQQLGNLKEALNDLKNVNDDTRIYLLGEVWSRELLENEINSKMP